MASDKSLPMKKGPSGPPAIKKDNKPAVRPASTPAVKNDYKVTVKK